MKSPSKCKMQIFGRKFCFYLMKKLSKMLHSRSFNLFYLQKLYSSFSEISVGDITGDICFVLWALSGGWMISSSISLSCLGVWSFYFFILKRFILWDSAVSSYWLQKLYYIAYAVSIVSNLLTPGFFCGTLGIPLPNIFRFSSEAFFLIFGYWVVFF